MGLRATLCSVLLVSVASGCAHRLSGSDLDRAMQIAFVSRIEESAGPRSTVFRDDSTYGSRLKKLEPKEADRRLAVKLASGDKDKDKPTISRFEVADTLRATTLALLPRERPWTAVINPAQVASALESFLVEEVPANAPDYELLKPLGADAVIEFVVEDYGMRSEDGRAGCYVTGYGRMFFLEGGGNVWFRSFRADAVTSQQPHVDPFKVAKDPTIFRSEMIGLLKAVAEVFAKDLNPPDRRGGPALSEGSEMTGPDTVSPKKNQKQPEKTEEDPL